MSVFIEIQSTYEVIQMRNSLTKGSTRILISAVAILVSLIVIPFSTGWLLGIFPEADDLGYALTDVFEEIAEDGGAAFEDILVSGTVFTLLFDVVLIFSAVCKSKGMGIVASLGGVTTLTAFLIKYIDYNDLDAVFDFDDCGITIGFWIPYILFIICLIASVKLKSKNTETEAAANQTIGS